MEKLLSPQELAKATGLKVSYFYHLTHNRRIPFLKLGNTVKFRPSEIESWLSNCAVSPSPVAKAMTKTIKRARIGRNIQEQEKIDAINALVERAKKEAFINK